MKFINLLPLIALLLLLAGLSQETEAQAPDPRFAQFYAAPLQLNPAMTGVFEGHFRVNANYREQWASTLGSVPFRTVGAGFDMRYKIVGDDYMGIGINAIRDEVGDGTLTINRGYLNLSYMKQLSGGRYSPNDQYLIFGGQLGAGQNSVDWDRFWYSAQFDDNILAPNTTIDNGEPNISGSSSTTDTYLDFNAGLMWYAIFGDNTSIWVGAAMNHLNSPDVSFVDGQREVMYTRWLGHLGGELPFNSSLSLLPAIAIMGQGPSISTTLGANFRYTNHDWNEVAIRTGLWSHVNRRVDGEGTEDTRLGMDAMTVAMILEINSWNIGVSYDVTTSSWKDANNGRGAFELSLIYVQAAKTRIKVNCPKF